MISGALRASDRFGETTKNQPDGTLVKSISICNDSIRLFAENVLSLHQKSINNVINKPI